MIGQFAAEERTWEIQQRTRGDDDSRLGRRQSDPLCQDQRLKRHDEAPECRDHAGEKNKVNASWQTGPWGKNSFQRMAK